MNDLREAYTRKPAYGAEDPCADRIEALEAEVERLNRYLFAARAAVNTHEVHNRQADRERQHFADEVSKLAHALAAMQGERDEAKTEVERLTLLLEIQNKAYLALADRIPDPENEQPA